MIELKDVSGHMAERGYGAPDLPFLSTTVGRISLMAFQPQGNLIPENDKLEVEDKALLTEQMHSFLALAKARNVDFATCPEYSCPWDGLVGAIEDERFPRQGALWSIGCESITPAQLDERSHKLQAVGVVVVRSATTPSSGQFLNILCHLFWTLEDNGNARRVALLQAKTTPMGGTDYERDSLICGQEIFRFGTHTENRLVCLICSDVLSTEFRNNITPELLRNTLVVHLQLNKDSAAAGFSDYRGRCCYTQPRTTEILCLNWAKGTKIKVGNTFNELVSEPKSIYYRPETDIDGNDNDIISNHKKGCFLTYWHEMRTVAFILHPDSQIFQFRISKPLMEGAAPGARRTAPKMEARYEWQMGEWTECTTDADDGFDAYLVANPESAVHLAPYAARHVDLERLMQLSTGYAVNEDSFGWKELPSFRLAKDDTSSRLRLCWSTSGGGEVHRADCQKRFNGLAVALNDLTNLPLRLATFKGEELRLTYESAPMFRKFRNIVSGEKRGTVVFLGMQPSLDALDRTKDQLSKRLYDHNEDRQILSILYRDTSGALKDHMDTILPPGIGDDPNIDPVDIFNA
ncbi:hypothetical protein [Xanthomonas sacchari]|nr:hypothetical protein [Xanthomonas sacchari]UYK72955.1 hypothetical protein NG828_00985 [Xanthomonas sacchari]